MSPRNKYKQNNERDILILCIAVGVFIIVALVILIFSLLIVGN